MPFAIVTLVIFTVLIIICVYIKDRVRLTQLLRKRHNQDDSEYESEMLRNHFHNNLDLSDLEGHEQVEKKNIMNFYINMMKREVYISLNSGGMLRYDHDSDDDKLALDNNTHCYPLCDKRF